MERNFRQTHPKIWRFFSFSSLRTENLPPTQQVSQILIWSIRNHEEKVRITLDPPELGHISLEIHRSNEKIKTVLWTDNPVTKVTLETAHLEIQKIVETEGFRLEKFDVFVQQDLGQFQEWKENRADFTAWNSEKETDWITAPGRPTEVLPSVPRAMKAGSKYLDLFV